MNITSKTILKFTALSATLFQGWAVYRGQPFSAIIYCSGIASLFTVKSMHEHIATYMSMKYDKTGAPTDSADSGCVQ